jgi:hypothetical protein
MVKWNEDWAVKWDLLVADAWSDPELKKRLIADPAAVLKQRGIQPPPGVKIKVIEETDDSMCLVLPAKPAEEELSAEQLESVAGGHEGCFRCVGCFGCVGCVGCVRCGGGPCGCGGGPCGRCGGGPCGRCRG